ncbi:MAG: polysaccharide deacetylase family protein [Gemmatimonadota bacterium]
MARYFCFRFDVDTHRCIRRGVPNLLDLAATLDAPFTFFVNMGRAVSRKRAVRKLLDGGTPGTGTAARLPPLLKLGVRDAIVAGSLNPMVGAGSPRVLRETLGAGHEIGLHGGYNHAIWQAEAHTWPAERIRNEIADALHALTAITGHQPRGFASPGWNTSPHLTRILPQLGFDYLADRHGPDDRPGMEALAPNGFVSVRTELSGEPGGVAYLEHLRARGLDDAAIRRTFRRHLASAGPLVVAYDHPYYAGIRELDLVRTLVHVAREEGFQVVRLDHGLDAVQRGEA